MYIDRQSPPLVNQLAKMRINLSLVLVSTLSLIFLSPQAAKAQATNCPIGGGVADANITPFVSDEASGSTPTLANTIQNVLPSSWKTTVGIPSNAASSTWFGTGSFGTTTPFQYQDPVTKNISSTTAVSTKISLTDFTSCIAIPPSPATVPAVLIGNSTVMQDGAPYPYNTTPQPLFWNQTSNGSGLGRSAVLFTFSQPVKSFGAWFGDLETRSIVKGGTPAILRLLDASGNRIGKDIEILASQIYNSSVTATALDESLCGSASSPFNSNPSGLGCGNKSTRWVGFVDSAITARVKQVLVIVGDDDAGGNGNAERLSFIGANFYSIAGTVFEDVNYGGGSGRSLSAANGVGRSGVRVELYDSAGVFKGFTTTDTNGKYLFNDSTLTADTYTVRVVNSTLTSSRNPTASPALQPVQTFRTAGDTNNDNIWDADPHRVGGENPAKVDAPANTTAATLASLNTSSTTAQSITTVIVGNASGVDFGFNFDTIVNTNDLGQGSLRQFILNSNALPNTNLDQVPNPSAGAAAVNPAAGEEASIFMISDGLVHPGLRAGLSNLLTNGVAVIVPTTQLPTIVDAGTSIDGRTQTANIGDTKTGSVGYVGTVGTPATTTLNGVSNPEVQISNSHSLAQGLNVTGSNFAARGISIYGFGTDNLDNNANIVLDGSSNSTIEKSLIGTASGAAINVIPTTGNGTRHGIFVTNSARNITIQENVIAENGISGIYFDEASSNSYQNITIQRNEAAFNGVLGVDTGDGFTLFKCISTCAIQNNYIHHNQAYGIQEHQNQNLNIATNTINSNGSGGTELAGIMVWGSTGTQVFQNIVAQNAGAGIYVARYPFLATQPLAQQIKISQNSFFGNGNLGIDLAGPSTNAGIEYRSGQSIYITANDGSIGNTVSNNGIDYPVITYSSLITGNLTVKGFIGNTLSSNTFGGVKLEFFIADNSPANQNGEVILNDGKSKSHGEGRTYLGSCVANSNSQFNCSFPDAGTLGLTDATQVTATAMDSSGNTSEFSAIPSSHANLLLIKRITAITSANTGTTTTYGSFVDDLGTSKDNDPGWPSNYLKGEINAGLVFPGDTIEYTVYYLNNGENRISQARICDGLNKNLDFVLDFNSTNIGKGILFSPSSGSAKYLTNAYATGDDQGQYSTTSPTDCNMVSNTTADRSTNTVVVDAANSANPILGGAYGSIKFKTIVKF
jgi:uncharacterized repeat protein (TIGR01451 family)